MRDARRRRSRIRPAARSTAPAGSRRSAAVRGRATAPAAGPAGGSGTVIGWHGNARRRERAADRPGSVLDAQRVAQVADAVDLRRDEHDEADERQRSEPRPAPAPRVAPRQLGPAEGTRAAEDGDDRRGQPAGSARGSAARRRPGRRTPRSRGRRRWRPAPRARAATGQREQPAARGPEQHRLSQDLADPPWDGDRDLVESGHALERLRCVTRTGERVQRVAADDADR